MKTSQNIFFDLCVGLCALLCLLSGCIRLQSSYPEKRYFLIDVSRRGVVSPRPADGVLKVVTFSVSPQYEGKDFVYRKTDIAYESDFYNEFLISPSDMFTEQVRQWMARSGLFRQVSDLGSYDEATFFLGGTVTALYGDFRQVAAPRAIMEIEFVLAHDVLAKRKVAFQNHYRREIAMDKASPQALVEGWNEALRQILIDLEKDLRDCLKATSI
jgi:cholesterol transport system auxiliary component